MADLLHFTSVSIRIPRKSMLKDLRKSHIDYATFCRYKQLKNNVELASNKLAHVSSVLERLLLKSYEYTP